MSIKQRRAETTHDVVMEPRLLPYAERQAPRYTSYPAAPHFTDAVDGRIFSAWLNALSERSALSLYLHVPYCRAICWYCGCNTYAARRDEPIADFVDTINLEIELVGKRSDARSVRELHWGGGTPNILTPDQFKRIHHQLAFWFDIGAGTRQSIEIDPRHLSLEQVRTYAEVGMSRASVGAQDFNPHVQKAIGRVQPAERVRDAIDMLRSERIDQINIDLMYGLPYQSIGDLLHSVRLAASMQPQRIALFGYAHVPWFKKRQRLIDAQALPDAAQRFDQAEAARAELAAQGYIAIGMDHFALPQDDLAVAARRGALHRSFQGYEADSAVPIIGLGPSAISTLPQGYAQNHAEVGAWSRAIHDGRPATARGHALSDEDRRRGALIEQIMCDFAADLSVLGGAEQWARELSAMRPLVEDGLVSISGDQIALTPQARPFCRLVAQTFDAYARAPLARHSAAV